MPDIEQDNKELLPSTEVAVKSINDLGELLLTFSDEIAYEEGISPVSQENDPKIVSDLAEVLTDLKATDIESAVFKDRVVDPRHQKEYREGEDPGIWLEVTTKTQQVINVNIFGGIRRAGSEMDFIDSSGARTHGVHSTARTDSIASSPSQININITQGGILQNDAWINIDPIGGDKIALRRVISYDNRGNGDETEEGHFLKGDTGRVGVRQVRGIISTMQKARDNSQRAK